MTKLLAEIEDSLHEELAFNAKWCYKFQHPKAPNGILIVTHKAKDVAKLLIMQKIRKLLIDNDKKIKK